MAKTKCIDGTLQPDQGPLNVGRPGTQTAAEHQDFFYISARQWFLSATAPGQYGR